MVSDGNNDNQVNDNLGQYGKPLSFEDVWRMFRETDRQFKETDKKFQETDRQFKETDKKFRETDKKIKESWNLFTTQWGRLIESLVEGDLTRVLQERGIKVTRTIQRVEGGGPIPAYEFDIIATNGDVAVVVEVKTTLRPADVTDFLDKMKHFRQWMPEFSKKQVIGAVAFLQATAGSQSMARNKGLFTIRATGKSAHITNPEDFVPKNF